MLKIEVNGKTVEANQGETILQALNRHGIKVPTLCHLPGLAPSGACRMCVVEVEGSPSLIPSCSYPVAEGMKIKTSSPQVLQARKTVVELLLSNHPQDCLYCVRGGDCDLQRLAKQHGVRQHMFDGARIRRRA
ncbi:MAG: 2Fe-2S iron-sulfur cluster-binding protein [Elusimicrobiota bacterium]